MGLGFRRLFIFAIALSSGGVAAYQMAGAPEPQAPVPVAAAPLPPVIKLQKVVVAASNIPFGTRLTEALLKEIDWPQQSVPEGTFSTIAGIIDQKDGAPVVLTLLAANEPLLPGKISRPGGRATLSSLLGKGMKAVTVRVNDVAGVAGFVLPGDLVDVLVTRDGANDGTSESYTDVLLQGVRVLAIDQDTNDKLDRPAPAKAVTLEVNMIQAQKVALGASVGKLSLALRQFGVRDGEPARRINISELVSGPGGKVKAGPYAMVGVTRGNEREEYKVPRAASLN